MDNGNNTIRLSTLQKTGVNLAQVLEDAKLVLDGAVALVYGRSLFRFARFENGELKFFDGKKPGRIYEVRVFNEKCELRWLARADDYTGTEASLGDAVILSEEFSELGGWKPVKEEKRHPERFKEGKYILWKPRSPASIELPDGWSELYEARIGSLFIPFPQDRLKEVGFHGRLALNFVEYLAIEKYGNCAVVAERLTGLDRI